MKKRELKQRVRELEQLELHNQSLVRRMREVHTSVAGIVASAQLATGNGIWGDSTDLYWVGRVSDLCSYDSDELLVHRAYVMANGRVMRMYDSEQRTWKLVHHKELVALVGEVVMARILRGLSSHKPPGEAPCPEVKFPLGTLEALEALLKETL